MFHCVGCTPLQATAAGRIFAELLQIKVIIYRLRVAELMEQFHRLVHMVQNEVRTQCSSHHHSWLLVSS